MHLQYVSILLINGWSFISSTAEIDFQQSMESLTAIIKYLEVFTYLLIVINCCCSY